MSEPTLDEFTEKIASEVTEIIRVFLGRTIEHGELRNASSHFFGKGKLMRPSLAMIVAEALEGPRDAALRIAAAIEMLNVFTLIHDDIIDKDEQRRKVPTVHIKWDIPTALLAGDTLHSASLLCAMDARDSLHDLDKLLSIVNLLEVCAKTISEGQCYDADLQDGRLAPTEENYFAMVERKTATLFSVAAKAGALLSTSDAILIEKFAGFGRLVGIGFQVTDDVLGIIANEAELGKPVGSDLREGKKSLPIIHFMAHSTPVQRDLFNSLFKKPVTQVRMVQVRNLFKETASIEYAIGVAKRYSNEARAELTNTGIDARHMQQLQEYTERAVERRF